MAKRKNSRSHQPRKEPRIVDHVSDSEDEEIPEDEAFNSEDERLYGSFFSSAGKKQDSDDEDSDEASESEDDDGIASDDEDDEGDGGQYMLDLLNKLDSNSNSNNKVPTATIGSHVKESEFASSVVKETNLTLDNLMQGLQDTKGFGVMQKTFREVSKGKTTAAPVAKVVSERAQRKVHYAENQSEVSQWIEAVQENRKAETLDFRPKERPDILTKHELVDKFVPTTEFEKELHSALQQAGQEDEAAILKREQQMLDDLGSNEISLEEYKKRRGSLAKMRALMFYHEQKRHHINKIKSKKYRRIRKKQRTRQKEDELNAQIEKNPDLLKELEEKEELERMKERATLAHKNTSKWAKRVLKRGKNVDVNTRKALSAQLKRGDDLRRKMNATDGNKSDDDDENEDLVETARKVLADTEDDSAVQNQGLFKLSFMQKGIEKQRERAKEEARKLLMELEANEAEDKSGSGADADVEDNAGKKKRLKVASSKEMKNVLGDGKLVASSLEFGNSNLISVSGGINVDLGEQTREAAMLSTATSLEHTSKMEVTMDSGDSGDELSFKSAEAPKQSVGASTKQPLSAVLRTADESNPWLAATSKGNDSSSAKNKKKEKTKSRVSSGIVNVEGAAALLNTGEKSEAKTGEKEDTAADSNANLSSLTQEQLVRRAFAAPTDKEVEEDFAKEKARAEERDDPTRKVKDTPKTVSGWGSWAGEGAAPPKPPRKLPKHLQAPEKKLSKRKRQDEKRPLVIINEKRQKKTANKYQIANIPYPYTSREEYERAMTGGIGREWNVTTGVKNMTRPEIITRTGKMIQPISKRVKAPRPAAKF